MSDSVSYRLRAAAIASEFVGLDRPKGDVSAVDTPLKALLPSGVILTSLHPMVEVVKAYVSIAEAEGWSRNEFSEEIFERACIVAEPFRNWSEDFWLHYSESSAAVAKEEARELICKVVKQVLVKTISVR